MAGLHLRKTGYPCQSWDYYITSAPMTLRVDSPGVLFDANWRELSRVERLSPITILDTQTIDYGKWRMANVRVNDEVGWLNIRHIMKPTTDIRTSDNGDRLQERQETAFISAVNNHHTHPFDLCPICDVTRAYKIPDRTIHGSESVADVALATRSGEVRVSMKMNSCPAVIGGGGAMLRTLTPEWLMEASRKALALRADAGDIYIPIPHEIACTLARSTREFGGPIDFILVGGVEPSIDVDGILRGAVIEPVENFAKDQLFLRVRKREKCYNPTDAVDRDGYPLFFSKPGSTGGARMVITNTVTKRGMTSDASD